MQLALTSPEDTLIVGFNVVPDNAAKDLAESRSVSDPRIQHHLQSHRRHPSRSEGKLKPREEIVHLGRALVRKTFKISRVGTIAGCLRYPGHHRALGQGSHHSRRRGHLSAGRHSPRDSSRSSASRKTCAKLREGFECGIKIAGYDDIKVGDVIEAYRIDQVKRTL